MFFFALVEENGLRMLTPCPFGLLPELQLELEQHQPLSNSHGGHSVGVGDVKVKELEKALRLARAEKDDIHRVSDACWTGFFYSNSGCIRSWQLMTRF